MNRKVVNWQQPDGIPKGKKTTLFHLRWKTILFTKLERQLSKEREFTATRRLRLHTTLKWLVNKNKQPAPYAKNKNRPLLKDMAEKVGKAKMLKISENFHRGAEGDFRRICPFRRLAPELWRGQTPISPPIGRLGAIAPSPLISVPCHHITPATCHQRKHEVSLPTPGASLQLIKK